MSTKLESLVSYLSGSETDPRFLEELDDPTSNAALTLEGVRSRSEALFQEPVATEFLPKSNQLGSWPGRMAWIFAGLGILVVLVACWRIETQITRLAADHEARESQRRVETRQLENFIGELRANRAEGPASETVLASLNRLEKGFEQIETRLNQIEKRPEPEKIETVPQPSLGDLANLRHEFASAEKVRVRQNEDLKTSIHEISRLLRLLINRLEPPPTTPAEPPRSFSNPILPGNPRR